MTEIQREAVASVSRMQSFDPTSLDRTDDLGKAFPFITARKSTVRLQNFYKLIRTDAFSELPDQVCQKIKSKADADYSQIDQVLSFDINETAGGTTPAARAASLEKAVENLYPSTFTALKEWVAFTSIRTTDFKGIEDEARATRQSMLDQFERSTERMAQMQAQAEEILKKSREVAAEQGVSQHAFHFKEEAKSHNEQSHKWLKAVVILSLTFVVLAIASVLLHKWSWLVPANDTGAVIQVNISKALVFGALTFAIAIAAKNYRSHRHNAIVNRHRQNALATFEVLVGAAGEATNRDIILVHAADCIFSPQPSGYSRDSEGNDPVTVPSISITPKVNAGAGVA